jgi:hypothetical protein
MITSLSSDTLSTVHRIELRVLNIEVNKNGDLETALKILWPILSNIAE